MDNSEAPVVMWTNYKRSDGFEVSLTLRGADISIVATRLNEAIVRIREVGGTPISRSNGFAKPQVPTKPCPKHQVDMKEKTNKQGEKFYSHSRGVYPNLEWCNGKGFADETPGESSEEIGRRLNGGSMDEAGWDATEARKPSDF